MTLNPAMIVNNCPIGAGRWGRTVRDSRPTTLSSGALPRAVRPLHEAAIRRLRASAAGYAAKASYCAAGLTQVG